jgi:hypothetical protein
MNEPSLSKQPAATPEQANAAILKEYNRLQWQCVLELFGPGYNFERLLSLNRAMNDLERRAPWLKKEYFLPGRTRHQSRVQ